MPRSLFPSHADAPRLVITNGMVVPNYSTRSDYERMCVAFRTPTTAPSPGCPLSLRLPYAGGGVAGCLALRYLTGVSQYGQMTAGSFCYIGPQGIVHGTTITVLNASRKCVLPSRRLHSYCHLRLLTPRLPWCVPVCVVTGTRRYLGKENMAGTVFVSAGLGGMSGAQAKAALICGAVGVIAEVNQDALRKRQRQGWVQESVADLDLLVARIKRARAEKRPLSIGYWGNVVDVWERLAAEEELLVDLGSDQTCVPLAPACGGWLAPTPTLALPRVAAVDQADAPPAATWSRASTPMSPHPLLPHAPSTVPCPVACARCCSSCHNPFNGGYYPAGLTFDEANAMMADDPAAFKTKVQESLRRHIAAINTLSQRGMKFWDYGNSFLLECSRAGADVLLPGTEGEAKPVFRCVPRPQLPRRAPPPQAVARMATPATTNLACVRVPCRRAAVCVASCHLTRQVPVVRGGHHGRRVLAGLRPLPLGVLQRHGGGPAHHRPHRHRRHGAAA